MRVFFNLKWFRPKNGFSIKKIIEQSSTYETKTKSLFIKLHKFEKA